MAGAQIADAEAARMNLRRVIPAATPEGTNRVDGSASSREFNRLGLLLTGRERLCGTGQVYPSPEGSPLAALGRSPRYGFGRTFFNPISELKTR